MIKFLKWFSIIIFILLILIPLFLWGYVSYQSNQLENKTLEYLVSEGYNEEEVLNMESAYKYGFGFTVEVFFMDEPHIDYNFFERGGEIVSGGPTEPIETYNPRPKRFSEE